MGHQNLNVGASLLNAYALPCGIMIVLRDIGGSSWLSIIIRPPKRLAWYSQGMLD